MTFYPAVVLAALWGGLPGGLVATILSALTANFFWMEPVGSLAIRDRADWLSEIVFVLSSALTCLITLAMRRAQGRALEAEARIQLASERQQAEEDLRRYKLLAEHSRDIILYLRRADGQILEANSAATQAYGYTREELLSRSIHELRSDEAQGPAEGQMTEADVHGVLFETVHRRKDGGRFPVEVSSQGATIGGVRTLISVIRDITERKRADEILHESESRLRVLSDNLPEGAIYRYGHDPGGAPYVDFISAGIERLTGVPAAEFMADNAALERSVLPEDREPLRAAIALSGERLARFELEVRHKHRATGEIRWSLLRSTPERCPDGSTIWNGIELDITDRKLAEEALRESAQQQRLMAGILETSEQPFAIGYPDGRMGICNRAYCELTGYSLEELQSVSWVTKLTPPVWNGKERAALAELERTGKPVRYEKEYIRKDGTLVPVELLVHASRNDAGKVEFYYSFLTDITERNRINESLRRSRDELELRVQERTKELSAANTILSAQIEERERAQAALHQSELAFRTLAESVPQLVWICNPDGLNVYFNQRWVEYTGLTLEESYGMGWNAPFHADDKRASRNAWNQAVESGGTYRIESRLRRADGTYRWFLMRGVPSRDTTGRIVKWFGTCTDIDDLKRAEQEARSARERLALAVKVGRSGTFEWDVRNNVNVWTPELEELYGLQPGTFGGRYEDWEALVLPEDLEGARASVEAALKTGEFFAEWRTRRIEGDEVRWIVANARVFFDEQGQPVRVVGFNRDITDRKRAEQEVLRLNQDLERRVAERTMQLELAAAELERRNREVERVNRMKTEFLARSSHELRTPLNAIMGYSDLLSEQGDGRLPATYARYVANIQDGAQHLFAMVNDLLDISRIESGHMELNREDFPFAVAIDEVLSLVAPLAGFKNIAIANQVEAGTCIRADRTRFKQVLYNLLSNAVKFTPENGRVWIEETTSEDAAGFDVGDTGIGIPEAELEAVFDEFHRVGGSSGSATEGTGLGLAITRRLVELHGGAIRVESHLGQGSRFIVSLGPRSAVRQDVLEG